MANQKRLAKQRARRAFRVRNSVRGDAARPRISVHRTGKHVYAQIIDDDSGRTLAAASSVSLKLGYGGNIQAAKAVGEALGKRAKELGHGA